MRARPPSWFSWKFVIRDQGNRDIALIDIGWIHEAGELRLGRQKYRLRREKLLGGAFTLENEGQELARAEKGAFIRSFSVSYRDRKFKLKAASPIGREFILSENGQPVGHVKPEGAFTRKAIIDLPEDIELPVRIFMAWLVFVLWKRDEEASS